jgi:HIV Tat-specific factor 1
MRRRKNENANKKKKKPNCTLYVTGLPKDVTEEEFLSFFKTAGIIAKDPITLKPMIKIYRDDDCVPKGDGRVTFLKVLSITNAFTLLDGFDFRPPEGHTVKLEIAKFENKEGKPTRPAPSKKQRRYNQEQSELGWDETERRHVIIKYMFDPIEAAKDPNFYENLRAEIETEFSKIAPVEALKIFERNPEGVVAVKYGYEIEAQKCIEKMNGRWFDGRQLVAEFYDGWTNYFVEESAEEEKGRRQQWQKWIEGNEEYVPEESTSSEKT